MVCIYDTYLGEWQKYQFDKDDIPDWREGHSANLIDNSIYIFGGQAINSNSHRDIFYNDMYKLSLVESGQNGIWFNLKWSRINYNSHKIP